MDKELKEWTLAFIKNKDLLQRKIEKIEEKTDHILVTHKDKTQHYYIIDPLSDKVFGLKTENNNAVCRNEEHNLAFLMKNWPKASKTKGLTIILVNLATAEKWSINPYLHSLVADPSSIKTGLQAMFDTANGKELTIPKGKKKSSMFEESSESEGGDEPEEE